jgi:hypothetical protein
MSRLTGLLSKLTGVRGRKRARFCAYRSETMAFKMKLVERGCGTVKRPATAAAPRRKSRR